MNHISNSSEVNPIAILAALGITDSTHVSPVQGGQDTSLWRVDCPQASYALRVFRVGQDDTFQRELAAMQIATQHPRLPIPKIITTTSWQQRPVLLLSWCRGSPLANVLRQRPSQFWQIANAFGQMQAQIHHVPADVLLSQPAGDWIAWVGDGEVALQALLRRVASPSFALLHLDYHPLNVLSDGVQITAVLDWANARCGDPRADAARTYTILTQEPWMPGRQPPHIGLMRHLLAWRWRRGYESVAGSLGEMAPFYAWAGAVMTREVRTRVADARSWWQPHHVAKLQSWTNDWMARAGVTD